MMNNLFYLRFLAAAIAEEIQLKLNQKQQKLQWQNCIETKSAKRRPNFLKNYAGLGRWA
ncbi:hypothetical protein [Flavobacterium sp.]|uniref:hypothetical protein n=1 Tax=Flavobacterium sp. TaxID=239 RepID=UPI0026111C2A|nr:hypothetical protein [Flavobacterium sp.]